eukprot:NODE_11784_length_249_cov_78.950000_g10014_i0.p3 GENE.NODE_11784_length_249_cov_78.950000_g10014_i0~~NODE_11784_length_249_cov_78.950000_g10014_i0.p3  ORF type:complete len:56 (+),score=8.16 NODE_11784_length_249_cov_78.950000_g10014_i0:25-168(+)
MAAVGHGPRGRMGHGSEGARTVVSIEGYADSLASCSALKWSSCRWET